MIYFDTEHEAYQQKETIEKWGKTYLTECTEEEYLELQEGKKMWDNDKIVVNPSHEEDKLRQAQQSKLQEASDKAFEYRNVTGLVSFNARPVDTSLLTEGESTLVLHTELLNQNDFFQRMTGFSTGMFTEDIIYNTKEDILVYLNAEETQAIYYAIIDRAGRLWNEDYMTYKALIEACTTAEEVEQIVIDYDNVPAKEQDSNAVETPVENTGDNINQDEVTDEDTTDDNESNIQDEFDTATSESLY